MKILNENDIEIMKKVVAKIHETQKNLIVIEDTAQKNGKHDTLHTFFNRCGVQLIKNTLPIGDYALLSGKGEDILRLKLQQAERNKNWAEYKNKEVKTAADRGISVMTKIDLLCTYDVAVDTKMDLHEVFKNVAGLTEDRTEQQMMRAKNSGVSLYILILQDGINNVEDIKIYCRKNNYNFNLLINRIQLLESRYGVHYYVCPRNYGALTTLALLTTDSSVTGTDIQAIDSPALEEILAMNTLKTEVIARELFRMSDKIEKIEKTLADLITEKQKEREEFTL